MCRDVTHVPLPVVYQLDHIAPGLEVGFDGVRYGDYVSLLRHFVVWDYVWYAGGGACDR